MLILIEYSSNCSEKTGSLWFYSIYKTTSFNADIANNINLRSFDYKAKSLGNTIAKDAPNQANRIPKNAAISIPLKYYCNFWRSLKIPLINCKI